MTLALENYIVYIPGFHPLTVLRIEDKIFYLSCSFLQYFLSTLLDMQVCC